MVKTKVTPPQFLQRKLTQDKFSLVKKYLPSFIRSYKAENEGKLPANKELVFLYLEALGQRFRTFKDVTREQIQTGYPGVYQIYDYIRKRANNI